MTRLILDEDIQPLSEFRANATAYIQRVRETRRPLVITQHGRSAAVLLDVGEYERLMDRLELLQDVAVAEQQAAQGLAVDSKTARKQSLKRLKQAVGQRQP